MAGNGGKRPGAGRKKTLKSEIVQDLRKRFTDEHFDKAVGVLLYAIEQKELNLSAAMDAAKFLIEQKIGKAKQAVDMNHGGGVKIIRDSI